MSTLVQLCGARVYDPANGDFLLRALRDGRSAAFIRDYVAWTLNAAQALAIKVVNPGGINAFKFNQRKLDLDERNSAYGVTLRDILLALANAVRELGARSPCIFTVAISACRVILTPRCAPSPRWKDCVPISPTCNSTAMAAKAIASSPPAPRTSRRSSTAPPTSRSMSVRSCSVAPSQYRPTACVSTPAARLPMKATRIIVTARNETWVEHAALAMTGFATSVIGCGCEAGIERRLTPSETPDGRPDAAVLLFTMSNKELIKQVQNRVGQCVLTTPTSACFAGLEVGDVIPLGKNLRFFGDGWQLSKKLGAKRYRRVPVMDGEFLCEENTRVGKAIGGGNFLILTRDQDSALAAAERAIVAMRQVAGVIMLFPGGVVRSGSKVGSKYQTLPASTNHLFCPTLRGALESELSADVGAVLEIVIDGLDEHAIAAATRAGIQAACRGRKHGALRISAGNYGGKLGPFHFKLRTILQ